MFALLLLAAGPALIPADDVAAHDGPDWPADWIVPRFAAPAERLDAIERGALSSDEKITFSALQGRVNATEPRILLLDERAEEGRDTWADTPTVALGPRTVFSRDDRYELLRKYAGEVRGVVLYDPAISVHHRNLAGTAAAVERGLPVSVEVHREMLAREIRLPILIDLLRLELRTAIEVYDHLHATYWPRCTKRLLLSARPGCGGDHDHARDVAAAAGAAVVWLDGRAPEERELFRNLFENALAACADPVRIAVDCRPAFSGGADAVEITVRDNGPGLTAEQQRRLFDAFYTTKASGTGLGMSIIRRILEAHGGAIAAGNADGGGAEFVLRLPRGTAVTEPSVEVPGPRYDRRNAARVAVTAGPV